MSEHEEVRELLGAHVLGGLDAADRARVGEHLSDCPPCQRELAGVAGLPALLRRTGERAPARQTSLGDPVLLAPLLARLAARRRRDRRRRVALSTAAVITALGLVTTALTVGAPDPDVPGPPDVARTAALTDAADGPVVSGQVQLQSRPWGTALRLEVEGLGVRAPFTLLVTGPDGGTQRAATWGATPDGPVLVQGACAWGPEQVHTVQVLDRTGTVMAQG